MELCSGSRVCFLLLFSCALLASYRGYKSPTRAKRELLYSLIGGNGTQGNITQPLSPSGIVYASGGTDTA